MNRIGKSRGADACSTLSSTTEASGATPPVPVPKTGLAPLNHEVRGSEVRPGHTVSTFARFAQGLVRQFTAPVAAAILGAATLPFGGVAFAQEPKLEPQAQITTAIPLGTSALTVESLFYSRLQEQLRELEVRRQNYAAQAPQGAVIERDLLKLSEVVTRFDQLMKTRATIPPLLGADLSHVLDALSKAQPGRFATSLEDALKSLPSGVAPNVSRYTAPSGLSELLSASRTDASARAAGLLSSYSEAGRVWRDVTKLLPEFQAILPIPLTYTAGGQSISVGAGSRVTHHNGQFRIESTELSFRDPSGISVLAKQGSFSVGSLDGFTAQEIRMADSHNTALLQGAVLGIQHDPRTGASSGLIRADRAELDLENGRARLEGARLVIAPNGDASLVANHLQASSNGATIRADVLAVDLRPGHTKLSSERMELSSGDIHFLAHRAQIDARTFADGQSLTVRGDSFSYQQGSKVFGAEGNSALDLVFDQNAQLRTVKLAGAHLSFHGAGSELSSSNGRLDASFDAAGRLEKLTAKSSDVRYRGPSADVSAVDGELAVSFDGDRLAEARARVKSGSYSGEFGRLELTGGSNFGVRYGADGAAQLDGWASKLSFRKNDGTQLSLDGGHVKGELNAAGALKRLELGADHLVFSGTSESAHPLSVDVVKPLAVLTAREGGGERLELRSGSGAFEVSGHRVSLDGMQSLLLETTASGEVDAFSARFPGRLDFVQRDGELSVLTQGLAAKYERDGNLLRVDFAEADVALRSRGLTAHIENGRAMLDDRQLLIEVDRAEVLADLSRKLKVDVQSVRLQLTRDEQGAIRDLDLTFGGLEAKVDALDILARVPSGERVRFHLSADETGQTIRQAFLQIPEGGELRLSSEDLDVRLGAQTLRFDHGNDGVYRLRGEHLDISARTKNATVAVSGGDAQVSLDPATGRLMIDEIRGTKVTVQTPQGEVTLDIKEMQRFLVSMTKFEGAATGAALHLIPADDGSHLTAELHAQIGGVPIAVEVNNAHELKLLGKVSLNQVEVYAGDPSGRGQVRIAVGPIALEGSAVALVGRYHPYDPGLMTESVMRFATTDGTKLFSGVTFESDGVLRLGTDRQGVNAELAVILPRHLTLPAYRLDLTESATAAPGLIASAGYRHGGTTASLFAGVLPGSHATLAVEQGNLSIAGVPVPKRLDLPTTAIAGARVDFAPGDGAHLGVVAGAFVNPMGRVESPWVKEPVAYGGFAAVEYQQKNWSLSAGAVVDVDRGGTPKLGGAMLRFGVKF